MDARQLKFDTYQPDGPEAPIRKELTRIMRASRFSRAAIADRISLIIDPECERDAEGNLLGQMVTEDMLYAFTSHHGRHARFPLSLALPFCKAVDNFELLSTLLGEHAETVAALVSERKRTAARAAKTARKRKKE